MPATHRYWVPADLEQFPEGDGFRYECIDGELLVTPAPRFDHSFALHRLMSRLIGAFGGMERIVAWAIDLRLEATAVVEPDLVVFRDPMSRATRFDDPAHLALVVEILSDGTARRDRGIKRRLYQRTRIDEYWVVDVDARVIERWRPDDAQAEVVTDLLTWTDASTGATHRLDVRAYFAEVWGEAAAT